MLFLGVFSAMLSLNFENVSFDSHEAGKPETAIPRSLQTAKETDLELKAKKKKKQQVNGELGGTDELTKEQVSGIPIAMDEEKQLVSVKWYVFYFFLLEQECLLNIYFF